MKARSFPNLYDVKKKGKITEKVVRSYDRSILKCLVAAKLAGHDADFKEAVCYVTLPLPIALFKTDKMMRTGNKAALVPCLLSSAGAHIM